MNEPTLHAIAPIFQVANLQRAIDYYTGVMGFELGWTAGEPPDRASLCRDSVEIDVEVAPEPLRAKVYIQVNGVDAYFARIFAAGARMKVPVADRSYGMRDGAVVDPDGNVINIGESLAKD